MELSCALRLSTHACPIVAFVGAGGKSTSMFRLAHELGAAGRRVVVTATTHVSQAQAAQIPARLDVAEIVRLDEELSRHSVVLLLGREVAAGKVAGVAPALVDRLAGQAAIDAILVEADGSRMRPFKAPGAHEPVVPTSTTHLVPVVGTDVLGKPLGEEHVHRPERVAELAGIKYGSAITADVIAAVLAHPAGGLKGCPPPARAVPLVNKADLDPAGAEAVALALLKHAAIEEVIVGAAAEPTPETRVLGRTAGVILAAGEGRRFGQTKQLLRWGERTLVEHVTRIALDAGLEPVLVVVGNDGERVAAAVAHLPVAVAVNPDFAAGQSSSVQAAVRALIEHPALAARPANAALFLLADQPLVTPDILQTLAEAHRGSLAPIVVPTFQGRRGNPVLFDRSTWPDLLSVGGDRGGRALFEAHRAAIVAVPFDTAAVTQDIDTPDDYEALRHLWSPG